MHPDSLRPINSLETHALVDNRDPEFSFEPSLPGEIDTGADEKLKSSIHPTSTFHLKPGVEGGDTSLAVPLLLHSRARAFYDGCSAFLLRCTLLTSYEVEGMHEPPTHEPTYARADVNTSHRHHSCRYYMHDCVHNRKEDRR